ncbi:MAG: hypothetical protein QOH65_3016 [Methylobacteriaceae bacterium]|jgi:hypothetical protein|nr:hypothetical protein [Methylobacteriaceae bacterium]
MANLLDIIQSAQGGKAAENLAARFGITSEQANAAIQAWMPALSTGLQQALQNPSSLSSIAGQLTAGLHQASFQSADSANSEAGVSGGSAILTRIFGDPNVTMQIAQQASRVTALRPELLARMAPVIATMVAGGLLSSLKSQGFSNILGQAAGTSHGGGAPASGGLAGLFSSFMGLFGAFTGGKQASGGALGGQSGLDALKGMLQAGTRADPQLQAGISDILRRPG